MKHIIYVPGLNDQKFLNKHMSNALPYVWDIFGAEIHIIRPYWSEGKHFKPKLQMILDEIDRLRKNKKNQIILAGQSAGGAAVLNAFTLRKKYIVKAVNICGRLRAGHNVFPSLNLAATGNPAFKESVLLFENKNQKKLNPKDRKKILVLKPYLDEIVPKSTSSLKGAKEIVMPIIGHALGGITACIFYGKTICT